MLDHVGPQRVQIDVAAHFQKVPIAIHHDGLEPSPEQMADLAVTAVVALRVDAIDVAHQPRQIGLARLHHEVVVIAHQTIPEQARVEPIQPPLDHRQQLVDVEGLAEVVRQQRLAVAVVLEDRLAPITTRSDVVDSAFKLEPEWAGLGATLRPG